MKISSSSKFIPNLFATPGPEDDDYLASTPAPLSPFHEITNSDGRRSKKQSRKHRQPKAFLFDEKHQDAESIWQSQHSKVLEETTEEVNSDLTAGGHSISQRPNILLTFDVEDESSSSECLEEQSSREQASVSK